MRRNLTGILFLALAGEIAFKTFFFLLWPGATTGLVLFVAVETAFMVVVIVLLLAGSARAERQWRRLVERISRLFIAAGQALDAICAYFDDSFIAIRSVFTPANDGGVDVAAAEESLAALCLDREIDKCLETKSESLVRALLSGDSSAILYSEELSSHAENIVSMLASARGFLPGDASGRLEVHKKNQRLDGLVRDNLITYDFYSKIIKEFIGSIIGNLSRCSNPLSGEILAIKGLAVRFISDVKVWEKDLTDPHSPKSFQALMEHYNLQNDKFEALYRIVNENYVKLDKRLSLVNRAVGEMAERAAEIQDISEKIKVLSINASIEAARSSAGGKGFKVIADQIKGLSGATQGIIAGTIVTMKAARVEVERTIDEFGRESGGLNEIIKGQQEGFKVFYAILSEYANHFQDIFKGFDGLVRDIDKHLGNLNPLFQLHELSIQELENLDKMIAGIMDDQRAKMDAVIAVTGDAELRENVMRLIKEHEGKIISRLEVSVLEKVVEQYGLTEAAAIDKGSDEIEIF